MLPFALNHVTLGHATTVALFDVAEALGCNGVELRNDLSKPLFDGNPPEHIDTEATKRGIKILALAEIYGFNGAKDVTQDVRALGRQAKECGVDRIVLIPEIAPTPVERSEQKDRLRSALNRLRPEIEDLGVVALIEPLGFPNSSLRWKEDAVQVLDEIGRPDCFRLIHDSFHHHLAGENTVFADLTEIVHISGVTRRDPSDSLVDADRGLIDSDDRLENIEQIRALMEAGYSGPVSFEAFAPSVQNLPDPVEALARSIEFVTSHVAETVPA